MFRRGARGGGRGGRGQPPGQKVDRGQQEWRGGGSGRQIEWEEEIPATMVNLAPPPSLETAIFPAKPESGSMGSICMVKANHFKVVEVADPDMHHYGVSISPPVPSKKVCMEIMDRLLLKNKESMGNICLAYDGSQSCYTSGRLPFTSKDFVVALFDNSQTRSEFKVSIRHASQPDQLHLQQFLLQKRVDCPQEAVQLFNVILRNELSQKYTVFGSTFFYNSLDEVELGYGVKYWRGFHHRLHRTHMGPSLIVDMSNAVIFEPILVVDFVRKYINKDLTMALTEEERVKVERALKNSMVEISCKGLSQKHKISSITTQSTEQLMFFLRESENKISVAEHYFWKHNKALEYPFLPAVQVGKDKNPAYFPMEACRLVEGQRCQGKLHVREDMPKTLKMTPEDRERSIPVIVENNYHNRMQNRYYHGNDSVEYGIEVKSQMTPIAARLLSPPMLRYHENISIRPTNGIWQMRMMKMVDGRRIDNWSCINFSTFLDGVEFCSHLSWAGLRRGMVFNEELLVPSCSVFTKEVTTESIEEALSNFGARLKDTGKHELLQLLIVILPDVDYYGTIKRVCETELGIVSQCCKPRTFSKCDQRYWDSLLLKINVKVGGRNSVLVDAITQKMPFLTDLATIVFGADVSHPPPGTHSHSIAAVVASMDWPQVTNYRSLVSSQGRGVEIIQDLFNMKEKNCVVKTGGMIRELLLSFYKSNNKLKPERIIFYRDGVGEGQFSEVLRDEVNAIRMACASLEEGYLPSMTFVVVQKKHRTRFFPADPKDGDSVNKNDNILPGTVVDTTICHRTGFDFYLCSHAAIHGTSVPIHYHVLYDENRFTADGLQMLTNNLCYTYASCTSSISVVPPVYYAHLAALRARRYIEGIEFSGMELHGGRPLPTIKGSVKDVMFYI